MIKFLQQIIVKFQDEKELCAFAVWVVASNVLDQEGLGWAGGK